MRNRHLLGWLPIALAAAFLTACTSNSRDAGAAASGSTASAVSAAAATAAPAKSAASRPSSEEPTLIRIEVIRREGPPIKSLVEDGSVLRLQDNATGKAVAFKPDVHARPAKIQVFQIEKGANGAESMRLLDEADVRIGATETTPVAEIYAVRIVEVIPAT